jgi:hypothetical protein
MIAKPENTDAAAIFIFDGDIEQPDRVNPTAIRERSSQSRAEKTAARDRT